LDSQEIPSGPSTRVSSEAHNVSITAQPMPLRLHHPLASEDGSWEVECASPRSGQPLEDGQPPPRIRELLSEKEKKVSAGFCPCCWCCCGDS
jgi:hypothetical protein